VDDTVDAFLVMGSHPKAVGRAVNFGTGRDHTINETTQAIVKLTGSRSKIIHTPHRLAEVHKLRCNPALAAKLFGWKARVGLQEGLRRNIEWHRKNRL